MRISDDFRDTVVFIGFPSTDSAKGGIDCIGTGFLLTYDGFPYLVTVRHVAEFLGGDPFLIRVNAFVGGSENLHIDNAKWFYDSDPTVDVAVLPFDVFDPQKHYGRFIDDATESWWFHKARKYGMGVGDFCYTIGLFRVLAGKQRNLPVVHFGIIARTKEDEAFPIKDWRDPDGKKTLETEAYLVESQSLSGLSGAPVFVRASNHQITPQMIADNPTADIYDLGEAVAMWKLHLIGIWQGAWDAPPGEVLAAERGKAIRVPVGMGVVLPIDHAHAILAGDELKAMRKRRREETRSANAPSPDFAVQRPAKDAPTSDSNPAHKDSGKPVLG
jgi:hypothetical protein